MTLRPGCPIQKSIDHSSVTSSLWLIAGSHVFHRLLTPRHPSCALDRLIAPTERRRRSLRDCSLRSRPRRSLEHDTKPIARFSCLRLQSFKYSVCSAVSYDHRCRWTNRRIRGTPLLVAHYPIVKEPSEHSHPGVFGPELRCRRSSTGQFPVGRGVYPLPTVCQVHTNLPPGWGRRGENSTRSKHDPISHRAPAPAHPNPAALAEIPLDFQALTGQRGPVH